MTQIQINIQMLFPYMVLCLIIHLCEISQNDLLRHPILDIFDEGTEKARGVNLLSECKQPAITMPWPSYLPQTLFTGNLSAAVFPSLHWNVTHNIPTVSAHCHGSQTWHEDWQLYYSQLAQHHMAIPCRIQAIIIFCWVFWPFDYSKAALLLKTVLYILAYTNTTFIWDCHISNASRDYQPIIFKEGVLLLDNQEESLFSKTRNMASQSYLTQACTALMRKAACLYMYVWHNQTSRCRNDEYSVLVQWILFDKSARQAGPLMWSG